MANDFFQSITPDANSLTGTPLAQLSPLPQAVPINFNGSISQSTNNDQSGINSKVRLVSVLSSNRNAPGILRKQVVFDVTPTFNESRSVEYTSVQPVHMPGGIQIYKHTNSPSFSIVAHFISRNTNDALKNIQNLQILRSWTRNFFGKSATTFSSGRSRDQSDAQLEPMNVADSTDMSIDRIKNSTSSNSSIGVNLLGAPPEVLYLYGYSSQSVDRKNVVGVNINRIPVVLTTLDITYPEDVDYIPIQTTKGAEPFPVKMDVSMTVMETHSPIEYENFSLEAYKSGTLANF